MTKAISQSGNASLIARFRNLFTTRDFMFHDGRDMRRFSIAGRTQALLAGAAAVTLCFSAYGVASVTADAFAGTSAGAPTANLAKLRDRIAAMTADMDAVKRAAAEHAERVEMRQALINAVLTGKGDIAGLNLAAVSAGDTILDPKVKAAIAPLRRVEQRQIAFAMIARARAEARFDETAKHLRSLGLKPGKLVPSAMGGPFEPVDAAEQGAQAGADSQFRSLFVAWKKLDTLERAVISIPSMRPVEDVNFSSQFGVRSDPFRGSAAMHSGVDIPGPIGTPVYATADGMIDRAGRAGGYGNLVEINHGRGIETRYGHLSKVLVKPQTRVQRGQLIGLMGSTGRSTGSHLHYEVRIDGHAVNPVPYLQNADYLVAVQDRAAKPTEASAVGGPAD